MYLVVLAKKYGKLRRIRIFTKTVDREVNFRRSDSILYEINWMQLEIIEVIDLERIE